MDDAILTCALTGVLTDPAQHPVPVTAAQMAAQARDAFNAGASIMAGLVGVAFVLGVAASHAVS